MEYVPKKFNLPSLEGISDESIKQHIGLYEGYVKNFNAISDLLATYAKDSQSDPHIFSELVRRRSFEFDGMRLHELYFSQFESGKKDPEGTRQFTSVVAAEFGSIEQLVTEMKRVGMMRGPGWSLLYFDPTARTFHIGFTGEQHQGHFATLPIILALDVWEHAYILDRGAAGKGAYIDAFFSDLNWGVVENRFAAV